MIVSVFTREWADVSAFEVPHHFVCEKVGGFVFIHGLLFTSLTFFSDPGTEL